METKFQTSFIPRKPGQAGPAPATPNVPRKIKSGGGISSIYMTIAVLAFVLSVGAIAGAYLWKIYLVTAQDGYKKELTDRKKDFNTEQITYMKAQSAKFALAKQLLNNHLATSILFSYLSQIITENVRFVGMDMAIKQGGLSAPIDVNITGYSRSLISLAWQSDVLNDLKRYSLASVIKNPIISNPILNKSGSVSFGLSLEVDPSSLLYAKKFGTAPLQQTQNTDGAPGAATN